MKGDGVQKMDQQKIEEMKKQGAGADAIIQALMENSSTFQDKTEYSKQKYINKKKKK